MKKILMTRKPLRQTKRLAKRKQLQRIEMVTITTRMKTRTMMTTKTTTTTTAMMMMMKMMKTMLMTMMTMTKLRLSMKSSERSCRRLWVFPKMHRQILVIGMMTGE